MKAVHSLREPGVYKPQEMVCMGLTVSSQEKSRLLFWSKMRKSISPGWSNSRVRTEPGQREHQSPCETFLGGEQIP